MEKKYDKNTIDRLQLLVNLYSIYKQKHIDLLKDAQEVDKTIYAGISCYSGQMSRLNLFITSLIFDEAQNIGDYPTDQDPEQDKNVINDILCYLQEKEEEITKDQEQRSLFNSSLKDLGKYISNKRRHYLQYMVNNYVVHTYSNFEEFMGKLYDSLDEILKKDRGYTKNQELRNIIQKYVKEDDICEQLYTNILNIRPIYISGKDKIDSIVKLTKENLKKEGHENKKDIQKVFQRFYVSLECLNKIRNTVHTGFTYQKDKSYSYPSCLATKEDDMIVIEPQKGITYKDYREIFVHVEVLFDMYTRCLQYVIKNNSTSNLLDFIFTEILRKPLKSKII